MVIKKKINIFVDQYFFSYQNLINLTSSTIIGVYETFKTWPLNFVLRILTVV